MKPVELEEAAESERTLARALERLPLFPLPNVVLFPHALLPLHVFEERYRQMARDVLASHRFLAVGLLIDADEDAAGDPPPVRPVAGVGEIVMAHELPDGRFNLVLRGKARIHIDRELPRDTPYRLVQASVVADGPEPNETDLMDADASLRALVSQLADAIPEGGELLRQVVAAQETAAELADVLAAALVAAPATRQWLLEQTDVLKRIERVSAEVVVMSARIAPDHKMN